MSDDPKDETYSEEETVERREAILKQMLVMGHRPHKPLGSTKKRGGKMTARTNE